MGHHGMTDELHKHWEAEDEVLNLQNVLDETDIKLQDAKAEIRRLNMKIQQEQLKDHQFEEQFEAISCNYINAQADLEQKEEDLKLVQDKLVQKSDLVTKLQN